MEKLIAEYFVALVVQDMFNEPLEWWMYVFYNRNNEQAEISRRLWLFLMKK